MNDRNVSTTLSKGDMGFTINCLKFETVEDRIKAKKFKIGEKGKLPNVSSVKPTYLVKVNGLWERCVKAANKLRKIPGATIENETKASSLDARLARKYELSAEERRAEIKHTVNKEDKEVM